MSSSFKDIFTLVSDSQEKDKVLTDLVRYSSEVKIKGLSPKADVFTASPRSINGLDVLCKIIGPFSLTDQDGEVIAQFQIGEQKYITQLKLKLSEGFLSLSFVSPLYKVQRREDFRLRIPDASQGRLHFEINGQKHVCRLIDISAGGCRIEAPKAAQFEVNQIIFGVLSVLNRDDTKVEASVRHVGDSGDAKSPRLVGLQFVNQTELVKNRMAALVMDLYREFFTRAK